MTLAKIYTANGDTYLEKGPPVSGFQSAVTLSTSVFAESAGQKRPGAARVSGCTPHPACRDDKVEMKEKDEDLQTGVYTPHPASYHLPAGRPIPRQPADLDQSTEYYNDDGDDKAPHACDDVKCDEQSAEDAGNGEKPRRI